MHNNTFRAKPFTVALSLILDFEEFDECTQNKLSGFTKKNREDAPDSIRIGNSYYF